MMIFYILDLIAIAHCRHRAYLLRCSVYGEIRKGEVCGALRILAESMCWAAEST